MPRLHPLVFLLLLLLPREPAFAAEDPWPGLQIDAFGTRNMATDSGVVKLETPIRAEDAAVVPMTIILEPPKPGAPRVRKVSLVIDQNPAPVAAVFTLGEKADLTRISTRVRVNSYTKVHAVAETSDGKLHVTEKFVKASGGCSAPAAKDPAEAKANMGKMKLHQFPSHDGRQEIQLMMRHPNHSGFQMDQLTRYYTPAMFVRELTIRQGTDLLLSVEGGISLSEDPNIRFDFVSNGSGTFQVNAIDTDEHRFSGEFPAAVASQ